MKDKLGADSQRRIETNPLRVLDSKLPDEQAIIETLPRIADHLCAACREHFAELKDELNLRGIAYEENWRLVRGLDYYTRTTFEVTAEGLGSQNAVCGGGRYDGLVELLGGHADEGHWLRDRHRPGDFVDSGGRQGAEAAGPGCFCRLDEPGHVSGGGRDRAKAARMRSGRRAAARGNEIQEVAGAWRINSARAMR